MKLPGTPPKVVTFDCYGTLIQWDEGLVRITGSILERHGRSDLDVREFLNVYRDIEHRIEQTPPYRSFREVVAQALPEALAHFGISADTDDGATLVDAIPTFGPFAEVPATLERLRQRYSLAIISNTDDDLVAGNVDRLGVPLDTIITARQAEAYKPDRALFDYAHRRLAVTPDETVHVCASPVLDMPACRELELRCIWINRIPGQQPPTGFEPDAELNNLSEVPTLLGA